MEYLALTIPGYEQRIDSGLPEGVPTGGFFKYGPGHDLIPGGIGFNIIEVFILLLVAFAVLFSLWNVWRGAWDLITSHGHKENVKKGWNRVVFAIMGLIFVFLTFIAVGILNALVGGENLFPFLKF